MKRSVSTGSATRITVDSGFPDKAAPHTQLWFATCYTHKPPTARGWKFELRAEKYFADEAAAADAKEEQSWEPQLWQITQIEERQLPKNLRNLRNLWLNTLFCAVFSATQQGDRMYRCAPRHL
jgi:hypothetical protein